MCYLFVPFIDAWRTFADVDQVARALAKDPSLASDVLYDPLQLTDAILKEAEIIFRRFAPIWEIFLGVLEFALDTSAHLIIQRGKFGSKSVRISINEYNNDIFWHIPALALTFYP